MIDTDEAFFSVGFLVRWMTTLRGASQLLSVTYIDTSGEYLPLHQRMLQAREGCAADQTYTFLSGMQSQLRRYLVCHRVLMAFLALYLAWDLVQLDTDIRMARNIARRRLTMSRSARDCSIILTAFIKSPSEITNGGAKRILWTATSI